ncbi:hypothetical protein MUK72_13810 [Halococcus dombrowskii]|uniref:Uncharacterized protein n=1 Tax=Halococcus dombrowskii TaxID=179637 RepID=A0AAV3SDR3_HALDO|nr:hypothetical protein [Halococcus dombrowskii]UOO95031.1 hypothetical protein MUK72_13810 [Halococcus dombrowskii]
MSRAELDRLLESKRANALLAWIFVAFVAIVAVVSLVRGQLLWAIFAASVVVLSVLPAVALRSPLVMVPWEVLALAALPTLARAFSPPVSGVATYLAVAALALIVAVELHLFTSVEMSYRFAVGFVVIATLAAAGGWAVIRWVADLYLGTGFLSSEDALMWEFVASTVAGVGAGLFFEGYVRRRLPPERLPEVAR